MAGNNGDILRPEKYATELSLTMGNAHNYEHLGQPPVWPESYVDVNADRFEGGDESWIQMPPEAERGHGKKSFTARHEYLRKDYLKDKPTAQFHAEQGLSQTRFHNGFYRRPVYKIKVNEVEKEEKNEARAQLRATRTEFRRQELTKKLCREGASNGVLTGNYKAEGKQARVRGRRNFNVVLSKETQIEGRIKLRQSNSRFHYPYNANDYANRRKMLGTEGIESARKSSLLGIGRADISSHGTNDNFSKSYYLQHAREEGNNYTARNGALSGTRKIPSSARRGDFSSRQEDIAAVSQLK